jgi:hypothetical protein
LAGPSPDMPSSLNQNFVGPVGHPAKFSYLCAPKKADVFNK